MGRFKDSFKSKTFKAGGYSVVATALVIAIAVLVNVAVNKLPSRLTKVDTTANKLYSVSDQTKSVVSSLEKDVTVYWVVRSGYEDTTIELLLQRYAELSDRLTVTKMDPDVYPTFMEAYADSFEENSLVVECGDRFKYVDYYEIYEYSYEYTSYYDYETTVEFDGENEITSAIDYVISDDLPLVYLTTGHGEATLSSTYSTAVASENILTQELTMLKIESIPEDADAVMINDPQSDINDEELQMLLDYLGKGGSVILITSPLQDGILPNINALGEAYGMTLTEGIVIEGDQNYYAWSRPFYLLPDLGTHTITTPLANAGYFVLLPIAQGIATENTRDTLTVTKLLTTSDKAYSKTAGYAMSTYEKEDGDIDGPFAVTAIAIEGDTKFFWCASSGITDDSCNSMVSGANQDILLNAMNWICGESESKISIRTKSLMTTVLTIPSGTVSTLTTIVMAVIPLLFIAAGVVIKIRRRRR